MKLEKFKKLKKGDKIIFVDELNLFTSTQHILDDQKKNGGFLTVKKLCHESNITPSIEIEENDWKLANHSIELYNEKYCGNCVFWSSNYYNKIICTNKDAFVCGVETPATGYCNKFTTKKKTMTNNEKAGYKQKICALKHEIYELKKEHGIRVNPYGLCRICGSELGLSIAGRYVSLICFDAELKKDQCTWKANNTVKLFDSAYENLQTIAKQLLEKEWGV